MLLELTLFLTVLLELTLFLTVLLELTLFLTVLLELTVPYCAARTHTAPYCAARTHTVPYCAARTHTAPSCAARTHTAPYCAARTHTVPYCAARTHTVPYCAARTHTVPYCAARNKDVQAVHTVEPSSEALLRWNLAPAVHIPCRFSTEILHQDNTVVVDLAKIFYTKIAQSILVSTKKRRADFSYLPWMKQTFFFSFLFNCLDQAVFLPYWQKQGHYTDHKVLSESWCIIKLHLQHPSQSEATY